MARHEVTLLRKPVIERKTSCEMLYHNLLDCDRQLTVCGTRVLPAEGIIPAGIMARHEVTLLRKPVIERKTSCEMLYHNLLDCDRQLTVCGTNVLLVERIIPTRIMARSQVTLLRKLVIERKASCEMLYHNLLDCDPPTNSLRYKRVTCGKNHSDRDNGALPSNTSQKASHRAKNKLRNAVPQSVRL